LKIDASALLLLAVPALAEEPVRGGELVFAVAEPPNYDCQATTTYVSMQTLSLHYSRLINFDPADFPKIRGELAGAGFGAV
jgi:peptide/nickel transport system substrate-binding protein